VDPQATVTQYRVDYGPTTAYGFATLWQSLPAGAGPTQVSINVSSLTSSSDYHLQVETSNAGGTTTSGDLAVHTLVLPTSGSQPPPRRQPDAGGGCGRARQHRRRRPRHHLLRGVRPDRRPGLAERGPADHRDRRRSEP